MAEKPAGAMHATGRGVTRGFILGKFLPPHNGHVYACEFARAYVNELTILLCALDSDPIPGSLRLSWMKELFPSARIAYLDDAVPQKPGDHPEFWTIWRDIVKRVHPEPIDVVFASEAYGHRLAAEAGARFVPVDMGRETVPVSASQIRADPFGAWKYLPAPVRAYYAKTVCLFGPESTGKTTLSRQLAHQFDTIALPEYGRLYTEAFGSDCSPEDLVRIAHGQAAAMKAARRQANRLLILDTDVVLTQIWSEMLLGRRLEGVEAEIECADFYLLTDIDIPWVDDGLRYAFLSDSEKRRRFFSLCERELVDRKLSHLRLSGTIEARFNAAVSAVEAHFSLYPPAEPVEAEGDDRTETSRP